MVEIKLSLSDWLRTNGKRPPCVFSDGLQLPLLRAQTDRNLRVIGLKKKEGKIKAMAPFHPQTLVCTSFGWLPSTPAWRHLGAKPV
ncbi:hypothetical protein [Asticcacaulis sp. MM231]|uniref:hypothetical protein n=1 Tax=Asticcacaulis sp. MM231 TaxID=3157666 RepID=UPI0032D571D5